MPAFRVTGKGADATERLSLPGDLMLFGEYKRDLTTVGAGTWTADHIVSGIIRRSGPVGGYTDTTDTADNILAALGGNLTNGNIVPGSTFRFLFQNTVAQAMTFAAGLGVQAGFGTVNCAASLVREYLVTILNPTRQTVQNCLTTNGSTTVPFVLPSGMSAYPMGSAPNAVTITPGMLVTGTGIAANTKVAQITQGSGGITGVVLDTAATATTAVGVSLTFSPVIEISGLGTSTL